MLNQEAIEEVAPKLVKENFYRIAHQRIYESMMDLYVRHIPIDHISLADNLKAMGQLEAVGGKAYLIELADNTFALTNWQNHLEIVKRTSILRDLIRASGEIEALAYDAPDDLGVVVEEAEKTLFHVTEKRVSSAFKRMDVLLTEAFEELTKLPSRRTPWPASPAGSRTWTTCSTASVVATCDPRGPTRRGQDVVRTEPGHERGQGWGNRHLSLVGDERGAAGAAYPVRRSPREPVAPGAPARCRSRTGAPSPTRPTR